MYKVYILYSLSIDKYYIGYTNDLERRLTEHNRKKGKFTDIGIPWKLVYTETFELKNLAKDREQFLKAKKSRKFIEELIALAQ
jgi:putative endonuclease